MSNIIRQSALDLIRSSIEKCGHHIYLVSSEGPLPRFAYTIGISEKVGPELVFAGAIFYSAEEVACIINTIASSLDKRASWENERILIGSLGYFSLRQVDSSWVNALMLGAIDYYGNRYISALQIVPDDDHWTIDIPNMAQPQNSIAEPVWQWLQEPWSFSIPSGAVATTNLSALRGEPITEAARWESDQWELFAGAGPDVSPVDIRVTPIGTLLAVDQSLGMVVSLQIGQACWRESPDLEWHPWVRSD